MAFSSFVREIKEQLAWAFYCYVVDSNIDFAVDSKIDFVVAFKIFIVVDSKIDW